MNKIITRLAVAVAAVAVPVALAAPGLASASAANNGTTNDMKGFATANHIHNGFNGEHNGIGWIRSTQSGEQIAAQGGHRVADVDHNAIAYQDDAHDWSSSNG